VELCQVELPSLSNLMVSSKRGHVLNYPADTLSRGYRRTREHEMTEGTSVPAPSRRQWGAERRSEPLSIVHPRPSAATITWGRIGIVVTILSWIGYVVSTVVRQFIDAETNFRFTMEAISYV